MLLDTMCNTFGGIILIAILVALLARQSTVSPLAAAHEAKSEMIERRIATAMADLTSAQELHASLADQPGTSLSLSERQKLKDTLSTMKAESSSLAETTKGQVQSKAMDPGQEAKAIQAQLASAAKESTDLNNTVLSQDQNSERLRSRLDELSKLIQNEHDARIVKLRFPKERAKIKASFSIICKYGRIYPVENMSAGRNTATIAWEKKRNGSHISRPIEGLGLKPDSDAASIAALLKSVPSSDYYISFFVYPDSIEAFRKTRDQAVEANLEFGLELEQPDEVLSWGADGSNPPPL